MNPTIELIKNKPYRIAQDIGFADVREYPHNEWMKAILFGRDDYTLLAHRGSYKSSVLSVCIALMMVVYPHSNIIFLRKTDDDVREMIRMVKRALQSDMLQYTAITLYKKRIMLTEDNASAITTNLLLSPSGASQLTGIGIKSSVTGKHADIVITDDICNIDDRTSRAERENTKTRYQELINVKNRGGRIINTGTRWHSEDVFSIARNIHIYDYNKTGLIDAEKIAELKQDMIPSLFACNYELKIIASDDIIFTQPAMGADRAQVEQGICHIDAAYSGSDYTAFTICRKADGKLFVFGKMWRKHVDDVQAEIIGYRKQFNAGRIFCEDNGDKGYLAKELRKQGERVVVYHENMNKFLKITSYLKSEWKNVIFVEGTDEEYINQIVDYNEHAEHDDAPDSLASIIRQIWGRRTTDKEYQPIW